MTKAEEFREIAMRRLSVCGAVMDGHFVYTSGRHGPRYVNKDRLYAWPGGTRAVCSMLSHEARDMGIGAVVGPAIGGALLAQWCAHLLQEYQFDPEVVAAYAEKAAGGRFELRRGYDALVRGRRVLVVEDVLTTGGSLRGVVAAVREAGGILAGVAAVANRGRVTAADVGCEDVGLRCLVDLDFEDFAEADCPLCLAGVPISVEAGKGREFLARKGGET